MLAITMRIRTSPFCVLPNPLPYRWDTTAVPPTNLLGDFARRLADTVKEISWSPLASEEPHFKEVAPDLNSRASALSVCVNNCEVATLGGTNAKAMTALHDALDWCDGRLGLTRSDSGTTTISGQSKARIMSTVGSHISVSPVEADVRLSTADVMQGYFLDILPKVQNKGLWLILVFRMICWLNLHRFHPGDVQIPKSDLLGTRQPVYIS